MKHFLLALLIAVAMAACGSDDSANNSNQLGTMVQNRDASTSMMSPLPTGNAQAQPMGGTTTPPASAGAMAGTQAAGGLGAGTPTSPTGGMVVNGGTTNPPVAGAGDRPTTGGELNGGTPTGGDVSQGGQVAGPAGAPGNGGQAAIPPEGDNVFGAANGVLAQLEMNGSMNDSSGADNHAVLFGDMNNRYVDTSFGQGVRVSGGTNGFNWTYNPNGGLQAPFTIEIILTVERTDGRWGKIVGHDPTDWTGIWFQTMANRLELWSDSSPIDDELDIAGQNIVGSRIYLALRSAQNDRIELLFNGAATDSSDVSDGLRLPNPLLAFFQDRHTSGNTFNVTGIIEAVRISQVVRTDDEIRAVNERLNTRMP